MKRGVRLGDSASQKLFISALNNVFGDMGGPLKVFNIDSEYLHHLRFDDDIVLISENTPDSQDIILDLNDNSDNISLTMNTAKTKK